MKCQLTFAAVVATKARITLAVAEEALSVAGAAVWTVLGHVLGNNGEKGHLLCITVVIVQGHKPVAGLHVARYFTSN